MIWRCTQNHMMMTAQEQISDAPSFLAVTAAIDVVALPVSSFS